MDLLYFLKVLFRKKWIILFFTFLAVAAAFVFLLFKKPLYESKAQYSTGFTIEKVKLSEGSSIADLYVADTKFDNVIETFKSPRVIGMISYKLLLHDLENPVEAWKHLSAKQMQSKDYKAVNKEEAIQILKEKITKNEILQSGIPKERNIIEFLKIFQYDYYNIIAHLFINRVNKTDYLDIVYRSENPELSAWLVNAMGIEFINYYKNLSNQRTIENVVNIRDLEKQQQAKIDSLSTNLYNEKVSQGTIDPISFSTNAMETVKDLESKLAEEKSKYDLAQNRIIIWKQQQKDLQSSGSTSAGSNSDVLRLMDQKHKLEADLIASGGSDPDIQKQLTQIRNEINSKSSSGSSRVKSADKIAELQNSIDDATALMNASQTTMSDYNSKIRYYRGLTNINPGSDVKMDVIKSRLDIEQKQLSNLKDKLNQAEGLSKDDPTANFTQTLIGQPAVEPEPKKAIMTMGISGMSVFFLTAFIFLFLEIFNTSIKTPYGFEKSIRLKLLSVINSVKLKKRSVIDIVLNETMKAGSPEALFKNNIRKFRYEIQESANKTFLFTSTRKGSGKSTIIKALGASMLLNKKRVLLIDLNMHHNTLTQDFNAQLNIQDLNDRTDWSALTKQKNINTGVENLDILGCIAGPSTPSEALYKLNVPQMISHLEGIYDFIFMEGPALNHYADSNELVAFAGKVLTVFSAEQVASQADKTSIQFIQSLKEKNMGAVLNNVLPENLNF
ncbi:MAG: Wzz/FepE/Etk N-terminal domain-containing protein [Ginsengibacter sp.]